MRKKIISIFSIGFIALALTTYFTFPLILNLNSYYKPEVDFFMNAWIFWYNYHSIITGNIFNITKFFNMPQVYPFPQVLAQQDFFLFPSILQYLPIYLVSKNHVLSVNFVIFSSFVLNFLSCYLCLFKITKDKLSSIIGSIVFTFSPDVIQLFGGHLEYMNRYFIPPFFLFLYNYFEKPGLKNIVAISIFYALLWFCNIEIAIFVTISTAIALPIYLLINIIHKKFEFKKLIKIIKYVPIFFLFVTVVIYYFYPYYNFSTKENFTRTKIETESASAKFLDFLLPFPNNRLMGNISSRFEKIRDVGYGYKSNYYEKTLLPGYLVLLLLPYFIYKRRKGSDTRWSLYFWIFIIDLILAFGPYATLFGKRIDLPYSFLYDHIIILHAIRTPARIQQVYLFFIAYLIAVGFKDTFKEIARKKIILIFSLVMISLLIEYSTSFDLTNMKFKIKPINYNLKDKKVLFLPITNIDTSQKHRSYNVYSIGNEYISINGETGSEWSLTGYPNMIDDLRKNEFTDRWFRILSILQIDYVIVDKTKIFVPSNFNNLISYEDNDWQIYDVKKYDRKFEDICKDKLQKKDYLNFYLTFDKSSDSLFLKYSISNSYNCDLVFGPNNRYVKLEYYLNGDVKKYTKYITLPIYVLNQESFEKTIMINENVKEMPNQIIIVSSLDNFNKTYSETINKL